MNGYTDLKTNPGWKQITSGAFLCVAFIWQHPRPGTFTMTEGENAYRLERTRTGRGRHNGQQWTLFINGKRQDYRYPTLNLGKWKADELARAEKPI